MRSTRSLPIGQGRRASDKKIAWKARLESLGMQVSKAQATVGRYSSCQPARGTRMLPLIPSVGVLEGGFEGKPQFQCSVGHTEQPQCSEKEVRVCIPLARRLLSFLIYAPHLAGLFLARTLDPWTLDVVCPIATGQATFGPRAT